MKEWINRMTGRIRNHIVVASTVLALSLMVLGAVTDLVVDENGICSRAVNFINQIKISHALYLNQSAVYNYEDNAVIELVGTVAGTGNLINGSDAKTTPVDADNVAITNSADSHKLGKTTWANIKATLKTYFDGLYQAVMTKAGSADIIAGIDDAKYATAKALYDAGIRANVQQIYGYIQDATITEAMKGGLLTNSGAAQNVTYTFAPNLSQGFWIDVVNEAGNNGIDSYTKLMLHLNNNATDSSASNHTPTATDMTYSNSAGEYKFGYAGVFNGTSSKITYPASTDFNLSGDFTITAWIKFNGVRDATIVGNGYNAGFCFYYAQSGYLTFYYTGSSVNGSWSPSDLTWYQIAVTRSGSTITLYVNGTSIGTGTYGNAISSTNALGIGKDAVSIDYFKGWIDELKIDNGIARAMSELYPQTAEFYLSSYITLTPDLGDTMPGCAAAGSSLISLTKGDVKNFFNTGNSWISKYTTGTWVDGL